MNVKRDVSKADSWAERQMGQDTDAPVLLFSDILSSFL